MDEVRFLKTSDIAKMCGVKKITVLRWIESGKLNAMSLPSGHKRIKVSDYNEFATKYNMPKIRE